MEPVKPQQENFLTNAKLIRNYTSIMRKRRGDTLSTEGMKEGKAKEEKSKVELKQGKRMVRAGHLQNANQRDERQMKISTSQITKLRAGQRRQA